MVQGFGEPHGPRAKNALEHVRIEYTGASCACSLVSCSAGVSEYEAAIIFSSEPKTMFLKDSVIAHGSGHGIVQGYVGLAHDWKGSNTFEDVSGCSVTLPANPDTSCPDPRPAASELSLRGAGRRARDVGQGCAAMKAS